MLLTLTSQFLLSLPANACHVLSGIPFIINKLPNTQLLHGCSFSWISPWTSHAIKLLQVEASHFLITPLSVSPPAPHIHKYTELILCIRGLHLLLPSSLHLHPPLKLAKHLLFFLPSSNDFLFTPTHSWRDLDRWLTAFFFPPAPPTQPCHCLGDFHSYTDKPPGMHTLPSF